MNATIRVVIPARYASTRLPGKPLALLAGRPMIAHVLERAMQSGVSYVCVATDDERIAHTVRELGVRVVLTSKDHASGTDRLAEVAAIESFADGDIIVNLQGDEPFVPAATIRDLARALGDHPECGMATAATPIVDVHELFNTNVVKVVLDERSIAAYFSRAPIPWVRDGFHPGAVPNALPAGIPFLRHLGLYAYRTAALRRISEAPQAPLECAESLEQLRALFMGIRIHVSVLAEAPAHGVDSPDDLARAEAYFRTHFSANGAGG